MTSDGSQSSAEDIFISMAYFMLIEMFSHFIDKHH